MVTDGEGRRVDAGHPGATAFAGSERATQGHERSGEAFAKAMRATKLGAIGAQVHHDILRRVMLEGSVMTPGNIDPECQHLAARQRRLADALTLADVQQAAVIDGLKGLAAIVTIAEDSKQLVHERLPGMRGGCGVESAQHTGASCFFKVQAYPELTL